MAWVPKSTLERTQKSVIYLLLFLGLFMVVIGVYRGGVHLAELRAETVFLPDLPGAILLSLMRMMGSYVASLFFAFIVGTLAATTRTGEKWILPILDILQSVPVVAFFPPAITFFIGIAQGHRVGVELAACFLIFTSQAWNIAFSVYESVRAIPVENHEAVSSFGLTQSRRFFKLYLPASVPRVVYNSILSWSNGWFFLVACEIIAVGPVKYNLPGIGSFLARAAEDEQIELVLWGLFALSTVILLMDLFVWRPALVWAQRFRQDATANQDEEDVGLFLDLPKTIASRLSFLLEPIARMLQALTFPIRWIFQEVVFPLFWDLPVAVFSGLWREVSKPVEPLIERTSALRMAVGYFAVGFLVVFAGFYIWNALRGPLPPLVEEIPIAILYSTGRIALALSISFIWILPVVYFTWNRPRLRKPLMTLAQLGASLPATALFPLIVLVGVRKMGGGMDLATLTLLTFGIQWYVLFNALGGVSTIPSDLIDATKSFGLSPFATFRKLVFPAIRPALITGAITAWGGGWNALVVSEYMNIKDQVMQVRGLGALLSRSVYEAGDGKAITLIVVVMVAWILFFNLLMWQPLYQRSIEKYRLAG